MIVALSPSCQQAELQSHRPGHCNFASLQDAVAEHLAGVEDMSSSFFFRASCKFVGCRFHRRFAASVNSLTLLAALGNLLVCAALRRWMMESALDMRALPSRGKLCRIWIRAGAASVALRLLSRGPLTLIESVMVTWGMSGGSSASASTYAASSPVLLVLSALPIWQGTI